MLRNALWNPIPEEEAPFYYTCIRLHSCGPANALRNLALKGKPFPTILVFGYNVASALRNATSKKDAHTHCACVRLRSCAPGNALCNATLREEKLPHYTWVRLKSFEFGNTLRVGTATKKTTILNQDGPSFANFDKVPENCTKVNQDREIKANQIKRQTPRDSIKPNDISQIQ